MQTESLAQTLQKEHDEIDAGIAAFTASPGDRQLLTRAIRALRRHIYLEEEFLFPLLCRAEPGLAVLPGRSCLACRSSRSSGQHRVHVVVPRSLTRVSFVFTISLIKI